MRGVADRGSIGGSPRSLESDVRPPITSWEACAGPKRRGVREVAMFLAALPLAIKAQRVRREPLPIVVEKLVSFRAVPDFKAPEPIVRAAARSCAKVRVWFGGLDTCLTRSLVAGRLLSGCGVVILHVGFRPGESYGTADGHAWLTLDERRVELASRLEAGRDDFTMTLALPFVERNSVARKGRGL